MSDLNAEHRPNKTFFDEMGKYHLELEVQGCPLEEQSDLKYWMPEKGPLPWIDSLKWGRMQGAYKWAEVEDRPGKGEGKWSERSRWDKAASNPREPGSWEKDQADLTVAA
uniref:Uncharacterized protein n=1 Tax=Lepeophtheirus salmonis TaxID=72036 RepID=A0A0K2UVB4_LEPSM